jgi:hypothetical protein
LVVNCKMTILTILRENGGDARREGRLGFGETGERRGCLY